MFDRQKCVCVHESFQIIALDNIFTMILSGYRPYTIGRCFCYKRTLTSYRPYTKRLKKKEHSVDECSFKSKFGVFMVAFYDFLGYLPTFLIYFVLIRF